MAKKRMFGVGADQRVSSLSDMCPEEEEAAGELKWRCELDQAVIRGVSGQ